MKNISVEEINLRKAILAAALQKNIISQDEYEKTLSQYKELEGLANKQIDLRTQSLNEISNKFNMLVTN
ncbi:hypothetical protein CSV61_02150 [Sporosarcina sp. P3]|uniref:hypothetical protein n=1 Tax=Sporosarcina sp. P3 TaxID=2048245 RepID=UPI000C165FB0|nr:hypothetical protein [Sporosarcina sp. P3]PID22469.1 hypothetical protein CSV61_02150 [Sporosarcina sp. P3]